MRDTNLHPAVRRSCPICEASCGIVVTVDREANRIESIRGDEADPRSRGYVCPKVVAPKEVYEDPDRLRRPMRKTAAGWREIGWEDACAAIGARLREIRTRHGNDAVAAYIGNPTGHNLGAMLWTTMFLQGLGTQRLFSGATVDQMPKNLSCRILYGDSWLFPIPDIDRTDYLMILGANPVVSNGSLMSAPDMRRRLEQMRARGTRVVVVDPRRTETAREADLHLFIRPGSDAYFLLAVVHTLFEEGLVRPGRLADFTDGLDELRIIARDFTPETVAPATGIAAAAIREVARAYASAERAVCYGRFGTCTAEFGTLSSWLVDVVNLLTGNLDRPGGLMFPLPSTGQSAVVGDSGPVPHGRFHSKVRGHPEFDGQLPAAVLAEEIEDAGEDRIRALITVAGNPVLTTPNSGRLARALGELEFMVAVDPYLNETTRFADFILPCRTAFEESNFDLLFQTTSVRNMVRYSPRVYDPDPGLRSHWEILAGILAAATDTSVETLDDLMIGGMLAMFVGVPGSRCEAVTHEQARRAIGEVRGPERLLDVLLRAGPRGDRFDDEADGLSLAKIARVPHAIDLGPLEPRLPEALKTPGQRIALLHDILRADLLRLARRLPAYARDRGLLLIGRRQVRNMNSWLHNCPSLAGGRERCTLLVSPRDAARLGLTNGGRGRVSSRVGEVEAEIEVSDEMMPGVVSLPHGFGHDAPDARLSVAAAQQRGANFNALADELLLDEPSGTAVLNGIPVEVRGT